MKLERIFAQIACSDLTESMDWYAELFGREPDNRPMEGLAEWEHARSGGVQLCEDMDNAGHGVLTLIVADVEAEFARLEEAGLEPGEVEEADTARLCRLGDPDENLVILAQRRGL